MVLIDDNSTDGTGQYAARWGCKVLQVPPGQFTYGRALNWGVQHAQGEMTVQLSAHAVPCDRLWLLNLVLPFTHDSRIAGVWGEDVPWPDGTPADHARHWYSAHAWSHETSPYVPRGQPSFSNSNSACRRDLLREVPFCEILPVAEDANWGMRVQERGWDLLRQNCAPVWHSHYNSPSQLSQIIFRCLKAENIAPLACQI